MAFSALERWRSDTMEQKQKELLIEEAIKARENAYTPYSDFMVGAALLTKDGSIYRGCNIENGAYSPSNCAERTAFFKAISDGERQFQAIAIVGAKKDVLKEDWEFCPPCGVCRQVMAEFCDPNKFEILLYRGSGEMKSYLLKELLPLGFHFEK